MTGADFRRARLACGLRQIDAAARLRVSQAYLAMVEADKRPVTARFAHRARTLYNMSPTALALPALMIHRPRLATAQLVAALQALDYPALPRPRRRRAAQHPAVVLVTALAQENLDARVLDALPWVVLRFWPLDHDWLVQQAKLLDLQNRLGFIVAVARGLVTTYGDAGRIAGLQTLTSALERSRLVWRDVLGCPSESPPNRSVAGVADAAKHWNITPWTAFSFPAPALASIRGALARES